MIHWTINQITILNKPKSTADNLGSAYKNKIGLELLASLRAEFMKTTVRRIKVYKYVSDHLFCIQLLNFPTFLENRM